MTNDDIIQELSKLPGLELALLTLARECKGPEGDLDIQAMAARQAEFSEAIEEARTYAGGTATLNSELAWLTKPFQN